MNDPSNRKNDVKQVKNPIGADPDEQAMNGLYGMAETEAEDRAMDKETGRESR